MNAVVHKLNVEYPYPGLRPFQEGEEHLFFGRECQTDAMIDKLRKTRFLAVIGSSGSGKSSLVNCGLCLGLHNGLMPEAGTAWRVATCRPGDNPIGSLAEALATEGVLFNKFSTAGMSLTDIIDTNLRMSKVGIVDVFEQSRQPDNTNLLIVIDQFEEMFRYDKADRLHSGNRNTVSQESRAFIKLLITAAEQTHQPIYIVLTMRSDFLGDCTRFEGLTEAINEGQYLVPRMNREQRRLAIAGPINVAGAKIQGVLLTRLVNDLGDNPDQLSILQHALSRIWAHWKKQNTPDIPLNLSDYMAVGSMAHALDRHAEKAFAELASPRQQLLAEKTFKALTDQTTHAGGIRRPTSLALLCKLTDSDQNELVNVIDAFRKPSRSFLMPRIDETLSPETIIDISHESLMRMWQRLIQWSDDEAKSARMYLRLTNTAALHAKQQAGVWRDPDLQLALEWRHHNEPNSTWASRLAPGFDQAMLFLDESRAKSDEEKATQLQIAEQERELGHAQALMREQEHRLVAERDAAKRQKRLLASIIAGLVLTLLFGTLWYGEKKTVRDIDAKNTKLTQDVDSRDKMVQGLTTAVGRYHDALEQQNETVSGSAFNPPLPSSPPLPSNLEPTR